MNIATNFRKKLLCLLLILSQTLAQLNDQDALSTPGEDTPNTASENASEEVKRADNEPPPSRGGEPLDFSNNLEPSVDFSAEIQEKIEGNDNNDVFSKQQIFAEATTNSGVANDLSSSGQPVVLTMQDAASAELQQRAKLPPEAVPSPDSNQTLLESSKNDNLTEEIPSFSEWTQKRLEEAEKQKEPSNGSQQQHQQHPHQNGKPGNKLRWKNYASPDCGAKVVASNPEAVSPMAILSPSRDEYKLNTCTSRIWFIVELCEAIQAKKIDLANFELFSSSPKDFAVFVSDRFPTREWSNVGRFTAKDERDVQNFDLHPHLFGKYIKVEVKSHYGSEHYCPISLFRVYGTSEFEVLQKEDAQLSDRLEDDDLDDDLDLDTGDGGKNLFSSATDAVISMVKKAASVLGNKNSSNNTDFKLANKTVVIAPIVRMCTSPSHLVVCDKCSDTLFGQIYELLSCGQMQIQKLTQIQTIRNALIHSNTCHKFGFDFNSKLHISLEKQHSFDYIKSFFPERFLGAMCNSIAVAENKVLLNQSIHYTNATVEAPENDQNIIHIDTSEPKILQVAPDETTASIDLVTTENPHPETTEFSYVEQIKPTKTLNEDSALGSDGFTESPPLHQDVQIEQNSVEHNETNPPAELEPEDSFQHDSVENLDENLIEDHDQLMGELTESNNNNPSNAPQGQKESVFLRLSNRIKALERNMSLSGQYLEELSKRYKKQVEEMQKLLEKTILSMNEEIRKKDEYNHKLEVKLNQLGELVEDLVKRKSSWSSTVYCVAISILASLFIIYFGSGRQQEIGDRFNAVASQRRKSVDVLTSGNTHSGAAVKEKKKRRPSDQALKIVRSSIDAASARPEMGKKRHKKKISSGGTNLKRSNSINNLNEEQDYKNFQPVVNSSQVWERQSSAPGSTTNDWVESKKIEEVPFVLEESEHSSLEPLNMAGEKIQPPSFLKTALHSRSSRVEVNGTAEEPSATSKKEKKSFKRIFKEGFLRKL